MKSKPLVDVDVVAEGLDFPEGPVAMADGSVLVVEVRGGVLTRISPNGNKTVVANVGGGPNGAAIGPDGAAYLCNAGGLGTGPREPAGIQRVDLATGNWEWLYVESEGEPFVGPNDLVFDDEGGFWFTDLLRGSIHYANADGTSVTQIARAKDPNGIGLSPDGDVLYWAQTATRHVLRRRISQPGQLERSIGFDARALTLRGGVDPFTLLVGMPGSMELDSLAVDSANAVCAGTLIDGGITEIPADRSPRLGGLDDVVHWTLPTHLDDGIVTNICFGGTELTTAFITCSQTGRLVRCTWHRPGLRLAFNA
jgi:gluconolactonase